MQTHLLNKFSNLFKNKRLTLVALLSSILLIIIYSLQYKLNLEFYPLNGAFQTFNPLRRIFDGEMPGRDFNPYLGLGTTYFTALITYIFGGNFAALQFSIHFIHLFLHLIALITLFFLLGFTLNRSTIASTFIFFLNFQLFTSGSLLNFPYPFYFLAFPGNSNLGLRSALPFLTSIAILLAFKYFRKKPKIFFCIIGFSIGIQPLWSNDYGIPSCLALAAITILYLIKKEREYRMYKAIIVFLSALMAFSVSAYILTGGHPVNWIRDNFFGVATDQFWYFGWHYIKIYSPLEIFQFHSRFFYFYIASILVILSYLIFKDFQVKRLLLLYIGMTVLGAGILWSSGGYNSMRYFAPASLVFCFILPLSLYLLFSILIDYWKSLKDIKRKLWRFDELKFNRKIFSIGATFFLAFYIVILVNYSMKSPIASLTLFKGDNFFYVKELGGSLSQHWKDSIQLARQIERELRNESPDRRILSTFSSSMDVIAGAKNPTGTDYIIHALGDRARAKYLEKLKDSKPKYITTLREDFTVWETWMRRTNWWFYREFFPNYEPVNATFYNTIWKRLKQPRNTNYSQVTCNLVQKSDDRVDLVIDTEEEKDNKRAYYVDISLKYHLEVMSSGIPVFGGRGLVNVTEKDTALKRPIGGDPNYNNRSYGMPPNHTNWHIPIEVWLGKPAVLEIKGYPENRSKLIVEGCNAQLFAPVDSFSFIRSSRHLKLKSLDPSIFETSQKQKQKADLVYGVIDRFSKLNLSTYIAAGWAILPEDNKPSDSVILTYERSDGSVIPFTIAEVYIPRPDVAKALGQPNYQRSGWQVSFRSDLIPQGVTKITFWAFDKDNGTAYKIHTSAIEAR